MICDHVLYVPEYYDRHQDYVFPGWASTEVFGREAPIEVEYCAGNGAWIVEKALAYPHKNWVAVEIQFERARKIWSKVHNLNLKNLFIICGEALTFTRYYVPSNSLDAIYVNFPDPWPKKRHAKNRLLKEPFLSEMARASAPEATATIVTDHAEYMQQIAAAMQASQHWEPRFKDYCYITDYKGYGTSYFEALWREQGIPIYYMQYFRKEQ
jgi:tRNA (guanine-N7-)-methyltransferase